MSSLLEDGSSSVPKCIFSYAIYCPPDVLKFIFEFVVGNDDRSSRYAIDISHVCQQWRLIALDTPRLWNRIVLHTYDAVRTSGSYLEQVALRTRAVPVDIIIDLGGPNVQICSIFDLRFHLFHYINILSLTFWDSSSVHNWLLSALQEMKGYQIQTLELSFEDDDPGVQLWNLRDVLDRVPSIRRLALYQATSVFFEADIRYEHIINLQIWDMTANLEILADFLPQLEELDLRNIDLGLEQEYPQSPVVFKHLLRLKIQENILGFTDMLGNWLEYLSCPSLVALTIDQDAENTISFIKSHPSITAFHSCFSSILSEVATVAPQLQHLRLSLDHDDLGLVARNNTEHHRLLNLKSLIIDDDYNQLSLDAFETLVTARCLPVSHSQSRRAENIAHIKDLEIRFLAHATRPHRYAWEYSILYEEAEKIIWTDEEMTAVTCIKLWWK